MFGLVLVLPADKNGRNTPKQRCGSVAMWPKISFFGEGARRVRRVDKLATLASCGFRMHSKV